jgi:hypothetical protein
MLYGEISGKISKQNKKEKEKVIKHPTEKHFNIDKN